jgi:hypothetical protein
VPRFAYTVGLSESGNAEIVLPGAAFLTVEEVKRAIDAGVAAARQGGLVSGAGVDVAGLGSFRLGAVDSSWTAEMLLGAVDFYGSDVVTAVQLVPESEQRTIDVPDMSRPWDADREPVWRWLVDPWSLPFSPASNAATDPDALLGRPITEAARWEDEYWEMFSGGTVAAEDARIVPLATLVGFDPSLEPAGRLEVGRAIRRMPHGDWESWHRE